MNPLLADWSTPFGLPPFELIEPAHFRPAFEEAMAAHMAEIKAIAGNAEPPSFANTIEALELSGAALEKVGRVFWNLTGCNTSDALQEVERWAAPALSRHHSEINMNEALFARVDDLFTRRDELGLDPEARRVLDLYHEGFVRAGAKLAGDAKTRMAAIMQRLAEIGAAFSQNVLKDEADWDLALEGEEALAGLPDFLIAAAAQAAKDRGKDGHVITLSRSLIAPFLQFSTNRALREQAWRAWTARGEMRNEADNRPLAAETVTLRAERARLLGYPNFAAYKLDDQMAKTPERVRDLLMAVWTPARARALEERDAMQALAAAEGANIAIEPWDWRHYAEKQRKAEHDLDEAEIKPYLQLEAIIDAAFDCAARLFGLSFHEIDAPKQHPDARTWEVRRGDEHIAVFVGDYFARASKRSGAWMSAYRGQRNLGGRVRPIICNTMNFAKGAEGEATLLTFDDARTLFHEFGHALHGMLSDVTFPYVSGTSVARDFVELPSQLYEHWLTEKAVLARFARHYKTGEPMPEALIDRVLGAETFGQGFASVEYTASALVDLEMHLVEDAEGFDPMAFEKQVLDGIGMPSEIVMRHRTPHFAHVFSGDGYSAGYYSYMWSEVMDADAYAAFEEAGDPFDPALAARLSDAIYAAGGRQDPEDAYKAFRGRLPTVDALLRQRGLDAAA